MMYMIDFSLSLSAGEHRNWRCLESLMVPEKVSISLGSIHITT